MEALSGGRGCACRQAMVQTHWSGDCRAAGVPPVAATPRRGWRSARGTVPGWTVASLLASASGRIRLSLPALFVEHLYQMHGFIEMSLFSYFP